MLDNQIEKITSTYSQNPVTMKIERVACYVRVSTQEQKLHGISIDAQKAKLQAYAEKNNMKIVEWYVDEGVSGRKLIRNRPELQRMIKDAEQGRFDRIIFIKLDRFFRSVAEYHECMKRIAPVVWSTTEEQYDLTTANGRMLVNFKLTIAEMEADQGGERIRIVNDYKVQTGQPLSGSMPLGFKIVTDENTKRKKIIRDPETMDIVYDLLDHFIMHQSKRRTMIYLNSKHHITLTNQSLTAFLKNTMLYGAYRDNPHYCEAYISKDTYDSIQEIMKKNIRDNTAKGRDYLFVGLIRCPECGGRLSARIFPLKKNGKTYYYAKYRCNKHLANHACQFNKVVNESTIERLLLANIEKYIEDAKVRNAKITDSESVKIPKQTLDELHEQLDRLNYSWQTGKIRKVETYEKQYADLIFKIEELEAEKEKEAVKDFAKIESIIKAGWKEIYNNLDNAHKRAFWRSFISSIEINWITEKKEIEKVNFF